MKNLDINRTLMDKLFTLIRIIIFLCLLILLIIELSHPSFDTGLWCLPLLGIQQLIEAIHYWRTDRDAAFASILSAVIAFVATIFLFA